MAVKNDPEKKESEIVVSAGSAQVQRGAERIDLAPREKITIPNGGPIQKSNVLGPPDLVAPLNLAPIIAENPKILADSFRMETRSGCRILYVCGSAHGGCLQKRSKKPRSGERPWKSPGSIRRLLLERSRRRTERNRTMK